jgi:hypothetical protein
MKKVFVSALMMCAVLFANAQANFSGTWTFAEQESVSGNLYNNGNPKSLAVKQEKETIAIETTTVGAEGKDNIVKVDMLFGGKASERTTASGRLVKNSIVWSADKTSFVQTTEVYNAQDKTKLEYKNTDTWSIYFCKMLLQRK